jgi:RNA polymerase sigma factor (sigma-70 family)
MEDKEIVRLYHERSEHAIEETKRKYGKMLRFTALRILGDDRDAEECENDVYLGAWDTIPPRSPENLPAYLIRIARNQALKRYHFLQAQKRNRTVTLSLEELGESLTGVETEGSSDGELADCLNEFLGGLKPQSRRAFVLRYWYYASIKEIMRECGMSKSQAESQLFRTRNQLRKFLSERGFKR